MLLLSLAVPATAADTLTADGLRAWLTAGGAFESNARLIHAQMQQQKTSLPPWWPDDVYAREEDAVQKVDIVDAGLPFYQTCLTESQARLMAKLTLTGAGQRVAKSSLKTHSQAAEGGATPSEAQTAGEDAATKTASTVTNDERLKVFASLTPAERVIAAQMFTPVKAAAFRSCTDGALAKTAEVVKSRQETALREVVEANQSRLEAAETQWKRDHPNQTQ